MAGNTRSADHAKQPFNSFTGHMHYLNNLVQNDGNAYVSQCEKNSVGFGSKYAHEFDSWNTVGAKFDQGSKMLCFESEIEEPVENGDHILKFVNGFAAQMRHNTVATYSSDESELDSCNLSTYENDSNISSSPSHCSAKSCLKSTSSREYCTDYTETDSRTRISNGSNVKSNGCGSRSPSSLRTYSKNNSTEAMVHDADIVKINNMAVTAGSKRVSHAGAAVQNKDSAPLDSQPKQTHYDEYDLNSNVIENVTYPMSSKAECNLKTVENNTAICRTDEVKFQVTMNKSPFLYRHKNSNLGLVQDWLDNNSVDDNNNNVLLLQHEPKLDGQRVKPSGTAVCKCCGEQESNHKSRGIKRLKKRKGTYNRKFEYEYEVVKRESLIKKKVLNGHSKRKKEKRLKKVYSLDSGTGSTKSRSRKRRINSKKGKIESHQKGSIRRKLALQKINETDAKKMIKELKRTLKRVSAEIEELKKVTQQSKKKKPKRMLNLKNKKGGCNNTTTRPDGRVSTRKHHVMKSLCVEPYRYIPKDKFVLQWAIPCPPNLTVRNGELEPTFSMVIERGTIPPKKHPIWSWKMGNPPLPGTVVSHQKVTV